MIVRPLLDSPGLSHIIIVLYDFSLRNAKFSWMIIRLIIEALLYQ